MTPGLFRKRTDRRNESPSTKYRVVTCCRDPASLSYRKKSATSTQSQNVMLPPQRLPPNMPGWDYTSAKHSNPQPQHQSMTTPITD
jgi:hypothetical protein